MFQDADIFKSIDFTGGNIIPSGPDFFVELFKGLTKLKRNGAINVVNLNEITSLRSMYEDCTGLETVDFEHFCFNLSGSQITSLERMFAGCNSLTEVLDTFEEDYYAYMPSIESMREMFAGCTSLENITFNGFCVMSGLKSVQGMFAGCTNLQTFKILNPFTEPPIIKRFGDMFYNCTSLQSIELVNGEHYASTSEPCDLSRMFYNCTSLESFTFDNIGVTIIDDLSNMFHNCSNIVDIDLTNLPLSSTKSDMSSMFNDCVSLKKLIVQTNCYDAENNQLVGSDPSITCELKELCYRIDHNDTIELHLGKFIIETNQDLYEAITTPELINIEGNIITLNNLEFVLGSEAMFNNEDVKNKLIELGTTDIVFNNTLIYNKPFAEADYITSISFEGNSELKPNYNFETDEFDYSGLFSCCHSLTAFNFNNINSLTDLTSVDNMFIGCSALTEMDLSVFAPANNLQSSAYMFQDCTNLTTVTLPSWISTLDCITTAESMFHGCDNLMTVNYESDNIHGAPLTVLTNLFANCFNIKDIDLSHVFLDNDDEDININGIIDGTENIESITIKSIYYNMSVPNMIAGKYELEKEVIWTESVGDDCIKLHFTEKPLPPKPSSKGNKKKHVNVLPLLRFKLAQRRRQFASTTSPFLKHSLASEIEELIRAIDYYSKI